MNCFCGKSLSCLRQNSFCVKSENGWHGTRTEWHFCIQERQPGIIVLFHGDTLRWAGFHQSDNFHRNLTFNVDNKTPWTIVPPFCLAYFILWKTCYHETTSVVFVSFLNVLKCMHISCQSSQCWCRKS